MVIHYGMTKSVESYYQQTGRAGRDGFPARCVLLFNRQDVVKCFSIASNNGNGFVGPSAVSASDISPYASTFNPGTSATLTQPSAVNNASLHTNGAFTSEQNAQHNATQRLSHQIHCMKDFSTTCGIYKCRRRFLLEYFGEDCTFIGDTDLTGNTSSNVTNIVIGKDSQNHAVYACRMCCDLCDDAIRLHEQTIGANVNTMNSSAIDCVTGNTTSSTTHATTTATTAPYEANISKEVYMLLRTIIDCGEMYGIGIPIQILLGKHDKKVQRIHNYASLLYFGSGTLHTEGWWKELAHQLTDTDGYISTVLTRSANGFSYQRYTVSEAGRRFLRSDPANTTTTSNDNYFSVLMHGQQNNNAKQDTADLYTEYDSSVHVYSTPLSRELRQMCVIEYNSKHSGAQSLCTQEAIQAARVSGTTMARSSSYPVGSTSTSTSNNNTYNNRSPISSNTQRDNYTNPYPINANRNLNSGGKAIFDFVPQSMAFDPQKVASYIPAAPTDYIAANTNAVRAAQEIDVFAHTTGATMSSSTAHYESLHATLLASLRAQLNITLLRTRNEIAQSSGLNPYNILVTSDIQTLVHTAPITIPELSILPGWGDWKVKSFGMQFVEAIKKFKLKHYHEYRQLEEFMKQIQDIEQAKSNVNNNQNNGNLLYDQGSSSTYASYQHTTVPEIVPVRPSVRLYRPNYDKNNNADTTSSKPSAANTSETNTEIANVPVATSPGNKDTENLAPVSNINAPVVCSDSQDSTGTQCSTDTDCASLVATLTADSAATAISCNRLGDAMLCTGPAQSQGTAVSSASDNTQLTVDTVCSNDNNNSGPTIQATTEGGTVASPATATATATAMNSSNNNGSAYAVAAAKKRQAMSGIGSKTLCNYSNNKLRCQIVLIFLSILLCSVQSEEGSEVREGTH